MSWKELRKGSIPASETYVLLRPRGTNREGKVFLPSVVRRTERGKFIDAANQLVRLEHHQSLEWMEIPT